MHAAAASIKGLVKDQKPSNVVNLMDALRKSMQSAAAAGGTRAREWRGFRTLRPIGEARPAKSTTFWASKYLGLCELDPSQFRSALEFTFERVTLRAFAIPGGGRIGRPSLDVPPKGSGHSSFCQGWN
jgi:hypothetical protein